MGLSTQLCLAPQAHGFLEARTISCGLGELSRGVFGFSVSSVLQQSSLLVQKDIAEPRRQELCALYSGIHILLLP